MKKASTLISAIIAIVVLLAAVGVGFSVKQFRVHRAEKIAQANPAPEVKRPVINRALPGGGERRPSGELSTAQRTEIRDERARALERFGNMNQDQREEYVRGMRDRSGAEAYGGGDRRGTMGGGRRPGGFGGMSEEERQAIKDRIANMTEEERQQYFEQMRDRFGGGRRRGPGGGPDGGFRRRGDGEEMREGRPDGPGEN